MKEILIVFSVTLMMLTGCAESESPIEKTKKVANSVNTVPVSEILKAPERFKGKEVVIKGVAEPGLAFEFVNEQPYLLQDATGSIWVITTTTPPPREKEITVKGRVVSPYQIKGRRFELAIIERDRK